MKRLPKINWTREYAKHFPHATDPFSRHVRLIACESLRRKRSKVRRMLEDAGYEPDHWADSMEITVQACWHLRARVHELQAALERVGVHLAARNQGKHTGYNDACRAVEKALGKHVSDCRLSDPTGTPHP